MVPPTLVRRIVPTPPVPQAVVPSLPVAVAPSVIGVVVPMGLG